MRRQKPSEPGLYRSDTEPPPSFDPRVSVELAPTAEDEVFPCLVNGRRVEIFDGEFLTVGREQTNDICIEHQNVSRRHATLQRAPSGEWTVTDLGSTVGTFVGDARIPSAVAVPLRDGAQIMFGSALFTFYSEDSPHQPMVRALVVDVETGALQSGRLLGEVQRVVRRRGTRLVALFDLDRFSDVQEREGEVRAHEVVRTFARELRQVLTDQGLRVGALFRHGADALAYLFRSEDPNETFDATAARIETVRQRVIERLRGELPGLTCAAAVTPVQAREPKEVLRRMEHKMLQAKLAGGNWTASAQVEVTWLRSDMPALQRLIQQSSVGCVGVGIGPSASVRRQLARALEALPTGTCVSVAWNAPASVVVVLSDGQQGELDALRARLAGCRWMTMTVADAGHRVHSIIEEAERAKPNRPECFVIASALADYKGLYDEDARRPQLARATYEGCLQLIAAVAMAAAGRAVYDQPSAPAARAALQAISACRPERLGAGGWSWLVAELMSVARGWLPQELMTLVDQSRREVRELRERRNAAAHAVQALKESRETAATLIEWCESVNRSLATPEWTLVDVCRVNVSRRGDIQAVECRELQGRETPRPRTVRLPAEPRLVEGLWLRCDTRWLYLRPFAEYRACVSCERDHLFLASGAPGRFGNRVVSLTPFALDPDKHPSISIEVENDDMHEAAALFAALPDGRTVTSPGIHGVADETEGEPTGLHYLPGWPR